jgi:hypothetical protein
MKRIILTLLLSLQFVAVAGTASADVDIPVCWPCETESH